MEGPQRITQPYWTPIPRIVQLVGSLVPPGGRVLEIGPGNSPFPQATEFVDWQVSPALQGRPVHVLDINQDRLPFEDKSFDFVYCRHTLEDIYNPIWVCREMDRIAQAGYIETPSPLAECCRGIDAGAATWRGYHHHRSLVWDDGGVLTFAPKFPMIELLNFGTHEQTLLDILNSGPLHWNTYFLWTGQLKAKMLHHGPDFRVQLNYLELCVDALNKTLAAHRAFVDRFQLNTPGSP